jgi:peptidoglycan-N-acetylglucosamine deacetylase
MKRIFVTALGAFLILSGCQSQTISEPTPDASEAVKTPAPSATPTSSPSPAASPSTLPAAPSPAQPALQYKMNKNYDIVPIQSAGGTQSKVILLTFDDGPKDKAILTSLLDTLDKHKAKAIFFVNGYRVKQNPDLLKLIHERGQVIGNHSWDHIDLKKESNAKVDQQITDVQTKVLELTGEAPRFFRPPFGSGSDYVREQVKQQKMLYMTWSNGSLDWETKTSDKPKEVIDNVLKQLHPGSNILMHELAWTAEALDKLLTELKAREYGFVDPLTIQVDQP